MLVLVSYNGSKLKEFTFGVNKKVEGRKVRKVEHPLNVKFSIAQAVPIRTEANHQNYLLRESQS